MLPTQATVILIDQVSWIRRINPRTERIF